jgi:cytochrome P450
MGYIGYNVLENYRDGHSLITTPSFSDHARRRKAWDRAFTPAALNSYTPMLHKRLRGLLNALKAQRPSSSSDISPVDLALWIGYFAKDFMGSFAFGGHFEFMEEGDPKGIEEMLLGGIGLAEVLGAIPWARSLFTALPLPPPDFMQVAAQIGQIRKSQGAVVKDLFYYVLDEGKEDQSSISEGYLGQGHEMDDGTLGREALLTIIAGSDTTVSAITCTIAYVLSTPGVLGRLRKEVDQATANLDNEDFLNADTLAQMPFLQAVL